MSSLLILLLVVACLPHNDVRAHGCHSCQYRPQVKSTPRIQNKLQREFLNKILQTADYREGFALFSYSGWSDRGQVMVFRKKSTVEIDVSYYQPNTRKNPQHKTLVGSEFANMIDNLDSDNLGDFLPKVYDGIEYEYVRAVKNAAKVEIVARVYMKMPSLSRSKPNRYLQIVELFTLLVEKFFLAK